MNKGTSKREKAQEGLELETRCWVFLQPFLEELHKRVDRRLVKTFLDLVIVILMHRNRNSGLLLSELGDHLLGGEHGPAGVKRIASLVHSVKWGSQLILKYLWKQAHQKVQELLEKRETAYVIWDESVLEKPESLQAEGLCAGTLHKGSPAQADQAGLFQSTHGSTELGSAMTVPRWRSVRETSSLLRWSNGGAKTPCRRSASSKPSGIGRQRSCARGRSM